MLWLRVMTLVVAWLTAGGCSMSANDKPPASEPTVSDDTYVRYQDIRRNIDRIRARAQAEAMAAAQRGDRETARLILDRAAADIATTIKAGGLTDAEAAAAKRRWQREHGAPPTASTLPSTAPAATP